jgi:hypothetical protein
MSLREIKKNIGTLTPKDLAKLTAWLHALLKDRASKKQTRSAIKRGHATQAHRTVNKSYRLEHVRCGKATCKCAEGKLHGPCWYAYWSSASGCRKASNLHEDRSLETSDNSYVIHLLRRGLHKKVIGLVTFLTHLYHSHSHR